MHWRIYKRFDLCLSGKKFKHWFFTRSLLAIFMTCSWRIHVFHIKHNICTIRNIYISLFSWSNIPGLENKKYQIICTNVLIATLRPNYLPNRILLNVFSSFLNNLLHHFPSFCISYPFQSRSTFYIHCKTLFQCIKSTHRHPEWTCDWTWRDDLKQRVLHGL